MGFGQNAVLYKIDLKTGKGTVVRKFQVRGGGADLEWDKKGENLYWSDSTKLSKLNIETGEAEEIMKIKGGSYCLARHPIGNLLGITIKDRQLFEIDLKKKKQKMLKKLKLPASAPSMTITQHNQIFIETFGSKIYFMKTMKSSPKLVGETGVCPWGLAIKPKFHMETDK